jgi:hypothetical protein
LYSNIESNGTAIGNSNSKFALSLSGEKGILNQIDKFWLMSNSEVRTFFEDDISRVWGKNYWTRTRYGSANMSNAFYVNATTGVFNVNIVSTEMTVRPAFKIA